MLWGMWLPYCVSTAVQEFQKRILEVVEGSARYSGYGCLLMYGVGDTKENSE